MKIIPCLSLLAIFANIATTPAATPTIAYDGRTLSLTAENQTFGQLMGLFQRQTGLEFDIPGDLNALRVPMVEIKNLSVRDALLKVLEGSNYDYILVASPDQPDGVRKLVIPGKSTKIAASATAFRSTNRPLEDPFGGGVETSFEENANTQPEPVPAAPGQNPQVPVQGSIPGQVQGLTPGQPGVQPVPANPNQPTPFGVAPQQAQPQGLQPFNPFGNQNNRRSPY